MKRNSQHPKRIAIECKNGKYYLTKFFEAPTGFESCILTLMIIQYFESTKFKKLSKSSKYNKYNLVMKLFDFVKINYPPNSIPKTLLNPDYMSHLRSKGFIDTYIGYSINSIASIFKWAESEPNNESFWNTRLSRILSNKPKFKGGRKGSKPRDTLSLIYENCPFNDSELIESLRLVSCWLLNICQSQRSYLLGNENVKMYLDKIIAQDICILEPPFRSLPHDSSAPEKKLHPSLTRLSREAYGSLINSVLESEDDILVERLFYSSPKHYKNISKTLFSEITTEEMKSEIKKWITNGKVRTMFKDGDYSKGKAGMHSIHSLGFSHLLLPSDSEVLAMVWLLASERIQSGGQENLIFEDISFTSSSVQIHFGKDRSAEKLFSTPIYYKTSPVYHAYKDWINLMQKSQHFLKNNPRKGFILAPKSLSILNGGRKIVAGETLQAGLLGVKNSVIWNRCLQDVDNAKPFLYLFNKVLENNLKVNEQEAMYESYCKKARDSNSIKPNRSKYVTTRRSYLAPAFIAQSREAIDNTSLDSNTDETVEARLTAHSLETKKHTYKDRSRSPERIASAANFAADVGELMVEDAQKIISMLKTTKILNLDEAKKILGLKRPSEDINELLQQLDKNILTGLFGEIIEEEKTIIIADKLTAALIYGYMDHIEKELPKLKNDNRNRAIHFTVKKEYLNQVIKYFPPEIRSKGKLLSNKHNFPYPNLA
ncbi:hypothetical protein A9Q99_27715 [Gammaproteobacteria bacterium 45_16_T64]|nr:hypothetical protein A9Q99_27715 [Gammaproteobacteria bacterium 45_16_T64]